MYFCMYFSVFVCIYAKCTMCLRVYVYIYDIYAIDHIDRDLTFALETENGIQRSDVVDYEDVKQLIVEKLGIIN